MSDARYRSAMVLAVGLLTPVAIGSASARTICAVAEGIAKVPEACGRADAERLSLTRATSVPLSVDSGGRPLRFELWLVDADGARRYGVEARAEDAAADRLRYAPVGSRDTFVRLSGNEAGNYAPAWHPGGRYLVWQQDRTPPRLWCLDLDRRARPPVPIEFAPEGSRGLFGTEPDGISSFVWHPVRAEIWVRLTRSPRLRRVTLAGCRPNVTIATDLPSVDSVSIAPDGGLLAIRPPKAERLSLVTPAGEPRGTLCGPGASVPELRTALCRGAWWHPEGHQLAFWRSLPDMPGSQRVVVAEISRENGRPGRVRVLQPEPRRRARRQRGGSKPALGARYGPDGRNLAFISDGAMYVVPVDGIFERPAFRSLSGAQGRYNGSYSAPVWLGAHHLAAVIETVGNRHPVVVVPLAVGRAPTLLSAEFPDHHDLAYDIRNGRLAVSAFDGRQSVFVRRLAVERPTDAPPVVYAVRVSPDGRAPTEVVGPEGRVQLEPGLSLSAQWSKRSGPHVVDLVLTLAPEKSP